MKTLIFIITFLINIEASIILLYHHIDSKTPKSTSLSPEMFEKHLIYLKKNNYTVLPLEELINNLKDRVKNNKKTLAITFDDGYKSVYTNAYKLLKKFSYPFTIFINPKYINKRKIYLSWQDIKIMQKNGATIGNHSLSHDFLIRKQKNESFLQYKLRIKNDIVKAHNIIEKKLNSKIKLFAYPFGEENEYLKNIIKDLNYYSFTQTSAPISSKMDFTSIPRFPLMGKYGTLDRFSLILQLKAFDVKILKEQKYVYLENEFKNRQFDFVIYNKDFNIKEFSCFGSSVGKLKILKTKVNDVLKVSVFLPAFKEGRQKINCTAPSLKNQKIYFWFSQMWVIKNENRWYKY